MSYAETLEEIGPQARIAFELWMTAEYEAGRPIPEPTVGAEAPRWTKEEMHAPLTAQDVAAELGVTVRRVNALASQRGVGRILGKARVFTGSDVAALRPGRPGRPRTRQRELAPV
jgi:hypothetical protein